MLAIELKKPYLKDMINPYYDPAKLDLIMLDFDECGLSYEYNTLCFWATQDGRVFAAQDSGCSCPTPFEDYSGNTLNEVLPLLERIGSLDQALSIFDGWNKSYRGEALVDSSERQKLSDWIKAHLTNA